MPTYAVHFRQSLEHIGFLTIEDERSLNELANTLQSVGYILTEDHTSLAGRPARSKPSVIFLGDVSRIHPL